MTHVNQTAYEGVEQLDRFDSVRLEQYRRDKLAACDKHVAFLRKQVGSGAMRVCEIGSGGGRLLIRLALEGMLKTGIGYETSASRVLFANRFAERYAVNEQVEFRHADFMTSAVQDPAFDLVIGIDVVSNLIGAQEPDHLDRFLGKAAGILAPQGKIVLEAMTAARELSLVGLAGGVYRTWKDFPPSDPFSHGLDEITFDGTNLIWLKRFLARAGGVEQLENHILPLPEPVMIAAAARAGLETSVFSNWAEGDDTDSNEYVVVLTKASAGGRAR